MEQWVLDGMSNEELEELETEIRKTIRNRECDGFLPGGSMSCELGKFHEGKCKRTFQKSGNTRLVIEWSIVPD